MSHVKKEEMSAYINGTMPAEDLEAIEAHLYHCEGCLDTYMKQISSEQGLFPIIEDPIQFTDQIIAKVPVKPRRKMERRATAIHYLLAAAATIFLMFSGVFQGIFTYTSHVESSFKKAEELREPSIADKVFHYFDRISQKEEK